MRVCVLHWKIKACKSQKNNQKCIFAKTFKRFFELYFEPVYRFVRKYTEEDAIARDITQDTFIRLYERRRDFDVPEKAKSFIYITARNLCLDHLKHQKNKTTIPTDTIGIRGQRPGFFT